MFTYLYFCLLASPLLNSILIGFTGRYFGVLGAKRLTIWFFLVGCFCSWFLLFNITITNKLFPYYIKIYNWFTVGEIVCDFEFILDPLTLIMATVILTISTIVHFFSFEYLETDPHLIRFLSLLSLFTFFMLFLVSSANLTLLYFGWEGVGILSYLLISFWYNRLPSLKSAIKAVLFNKIGDIALLFAIGLLTVYCGSTDFAIIKEMIPFLVSTKLIGNISIGAVIGSLIIIAAIGKSAQLSLHLWLPDAMEGPTPVSALLHAATMVTAGVFLLLRFHMLLDVLESAKIFLLVLGLGTAFGAGLLSAMSTDLKKSIAYSTCSQLGYMFFACGAGLFSLSLYHLFNHAFYKALLFISAGRLISITGSQDSRYMASSSFILPLNTFYQVIAGLSLAGVPAFSGFYSKELILDQTSALSFESFTNFYSYSIIFFIGGSVTAFLTAYYTSNQILQLLSESFMQEILFFYRRTKSSFYSAIFHNLTIQKVLLELGLVVLVSASLLSGSTFYYFFSTLDIFEHSSFYNQSFILAEMCFVDLEYGIFETLPLYCSLLGFGYSFLKTQRPKSIRNHSIINRKNNFGNTLIILQPATFFWIEQKLYFEFWCCEYLISNTLLFAFTLVKNLEKGFFEYMFIWITYTRIYFVSMFFLKQTQTGDFRYYFLRIFQAVFICFVVLIFIVQ